MTKLKGDVVTPLTFKSDAPESLCMRRFSFTSATAHRTCATLIRMKINDSEELGLNEVHLKLIFDHVKSFNQTEIFEWDDDDDANYVDSLKHENSYSCMEREKFLAVL